MDTQRINDLADELKEVLAGAGRIAEERDLLKRVLKQAVLTHGGKLLVGVEFAELAKNEKRQLFMGGGAVILE